MTDQELLRAYTESRDVDSLSTFLCRYQESLLRFVAKLLGDRDAAQDVVQETFLQVARHPARLLRVDSCHNWLLRVARNIGIDHLRRLARHRRHREALEQHVEARTAERAGSVAGSLEQDEVRTLVRTEIAKLKPRYRELLLLKVQEGKSYKEIAEITGLTVTNVGYLLHQAMKSLSNRLESRRGELA